MLSGVSAMDGTLPRPADARQAPEDPALPAEVFVVFPPRAAGTRPRWWQGLIDPWRAHVIAIWQAGPVALALDHEGRHLRVETMGALSAEDAARGLMWHWGAEGLRVRPPPGRRRGAAWRPPMTCVETVKAVLGLTDWRVMTPRQLRRALIRMGARPIAPFPEWRAR